jgi:hypothetical protein
MSPLRVHAPFVPADWLLLTRPYPTSRGGLFDFRSHPAGKEWVEHHTAAENEPCLASTDPAGASRPITTSTSLLVDSASITKYSLYISLFLGGFVSFFLTVRLPSPSRCSHSVSRHRQPTHAPQLLTLLVRPSTPNRTRQWPHVLDFIILTASSSVTRPFN